MKNILLLSNHIFVWLFKTYFLIIAAVITILEFGLLWINSGALTGWRTPYAFMPYEYMLTESGVVMVPVLGIFCVIAAIFVHGITLRRNHKPIYTIYTLPMPRWHTYCAFLLSGIVLTAVFFALQFLLLSGFYFTFTHLANSQSLQAVLMTEAGEKVKGIDGMVNNGFFLALIRNPILSILFPTTFFGALQLAIIVVLLLSACYLGTLGKDRPAWSVGFPFLMLAGNLCYSLYNRPDETDILILMLHMALTALVIGVGIYAISMGEGGDGK